LFVPQNAERSVFNLKWNGRACKFFPFLAILDDIKNISVDLLADKEKKKRVKKKTESSTAS